jgi:hypothetical protein
MTRAANARIAGFTFLFYIATAFPSMVLFDRATTGEGAAAKLARIAQHATDVRITVLLSLLACFAAVTLAVSLYAVTRDEDNEVALFGLSFRFGEGLMNAAFSVVTVALLWLATSTTRAPDATSTYALTELLLKVGGWGTTVSATLFAAGRTCFSYLLLRGRMIPVSLAWLGVVASLLLVVCLPLQLAGFLRGPVISLMWLPMAAFEVPLGFWLLIKGVEERTKGGRASGGSAVHVH